MKPGYCKVCRNWFGFPSHFKSIYHIRNETLKEYCADCDVWVFDIEKHLNSKTHKKVLKNQTTETLSKISIA